MRAGAPGMHRQQGIALAVVVWFLAGMSLLVAGIVLSARTDVRLAQIHYARAQVSAAGDGGINLLLADLAERRIEPEAGVMPQGRYRVGEDRVAVHAVPTDALVDVGTASAREITAVARLALGGSEGNGEAVARAVIQYRDRPARNVRIESIEDLLGASGVNRATLDALRDYITVSRRGIRGGGSSTPANPEEGNALLEALRRWTPQARAQHPELLAQGRLPPGASGAGSGYRVDALVRRGRDVWLRRRWVTLGGGTDTLPWKFTRTEPVRMVPRP